MVVAERGVLPGVPLLARQLGQSGAVADHPLKQLVRHFGAMERPAALGKVVAPGQEQRHQPPDDEGEHLDRAAHPLGDDEARDDQIQHRKDRQQAAAQRQLLDHLRLHHPTEVATGAILADLVRAELEDARQQLLLEHAADLQREDPLPPDLQQPQRDGAGQKGDPAGEPTHLQASLQRCPAEHPERPGQHQREQRMVDQDLHQQPGSCAEQHARARGGRGPHHPAGA